MLRTQLFSTSNSIIGEQGMVATSQPLAAQAGLDILKQGGNAIDAAIATAACMTVVEPTCCGMGGDAFAIIHTQDGLYGINGSGTAPLSISIEALKDRGYEEMPLMGWCPITVPGIPKTWASLSKRFGSMSLKQVLEPAIQHARNGYHVTPSIAKAWERTYHIYNNKAEKADYAEWYRVYAPQGRVPKAGELWASLDHASTLQEIGDTQAESFYRGRLAREISKASLDAGGYLSYEDLANYEIKWVSPLYQTYHGYDIWELPPNGQGVIALVALNILEHCDIKMEEKEEWTHQQIEAIKCAFAMASREIVDPSDVNQERLDYLLSSDFALSCAATITEKAVEYSPLSLPEGGTVYLCTADNAGNMVSYIQSNYYGFGSGIVIPGTGITMQNRGYDFKFEESHPNVLQAGKRPYHTIMPGFLTKQGEAIGPFGIMGGYMQPQAHVQVMLHLIDGMMSPQDILDTPRFRWVQGLKVEVEPEYSASINNKLLSRGHEVTVSEDIDAFGRGQMILRDPISGRYIGGTERRVDGMVAAY